MSDAARIDGYAAALLDVARAEGDQTGLSEELFQVAQAFEASDELRETLTDRRIPLDRKKGVVDDVLGGRASEATIGLVNLLVTTGRIGDFADIARRAIDLAAAGEEAVVAEVRSAVSLNEATVSRLATKLGRLTGKKIKPQVVIDPDVVGGLIVKVGDTIYDGSVRNRFDELREAWG
jgi:F-type H+-transporting ATPase subunit delta